MACITDRYIGHRLDSNIRIKTCIIEGREMLTKAIDIAVNAHRGQADKCKEPYILHPMAVMTAMYTHAEEIVAVLHDVVEDTDWTLQQIRVEGFPEKIILAIDAITKRENETYFEYIYRVKNNPLATKVKLADLQHNSLLSRQFEKSGRLIERYLKAYKILKGETK